MQLSHGKRQHIILWSPATLGLDILAPCTRGNRTRGISVALPGWSTDSADSDVEMMTLWKLRGKLSWNFCRKYPPVSTTKLRLTGTSETFEVSAKMGAIQSDRSDTGYMDLHGHSVWWTALDIPRYIIDIIHDPSIDLSPVWSNFIFCRNLSWPLHIISAICIHLMLMIGIFSAPPLRSRTQGLRPSCTAGSIGGGPKPEWNAPMKIPMRCWSCIACSLQDWIWFYKS